MAFDKYDDVIDSRDVIERIEELQDAQSDLSTAIDEYRTAEEARDEEEIAAALKARDQAEEFFSDKEDAELSILIALQEEGHGSADWTHGETLIRDSYFQEYAQQFAEDIGAINPDASWPNDCIDWERAARELRYDYTSVNFDNVIYWIRS